MDSVQRKVRAAALSVGSNLFLVAAKAAVGLAIGSVSILSEAIHSFSDLLAAFIAFFSVRVSGRPADAEHPFGHGKIENISATAEALLIFAGSGWILYEAVQKFLHPVPLKKIGWGVAVMLFSAVVNFFVSRHLYRVGRETDSIALQADGLHLKTDVYTSAGVMLSLAAIWAGRKTGLPLDLSWLDPAAAVAVSVLILKLAFDLLREAAAGLLDARLPQAEENRLIQLIKSYDADIHGYHGLRTRKAGHLRFVEFHMQVDPDMSVEASHAITERIAACIRADFPHTTVTVHTEPCTGQLSGKCREGCFLRQKRYPPPERRGLGAVSSMR